jgi:hypothetical protein
MRTGLREAVQRLREGDATQANLVLAHTRWLVAMLVTKNKSRYGRIISTRDLRRDARDAVIESAILYHGDPVEWSEIDRAVLGDIDNRLRDRVSPIVGFRRVATYEIPYNAEAAPLSAPHHPLHGFLSAYAPSSDVEVLYMKTDGMTTREIARRLGVSQARVVFRFKRCTLRLREKLQTREVYHST